jgi:hypothetical protein
MTTKKEKNIIVEQVLVHGYVVHANGKKSPFVFDKTAFSAKALDPILREVGGHYGV